MACRIQQWAPVDYITAPGSGLPQTLTWAQPATTILTWHPRHDVIHSQPWAPHPVLLYKIGIGRRPLQEFHGVLIALRCCSGVLQVAFCAGPLVQTLLRSGAHNYVEFKLLQGRCVPAPLFVDVNQSCRRMLFGDTANVW